MAGERRPGSDAGKATIAWDEAFIYFSSLRRDQRCYQAVADTFGVSVRTVERHGRRERWKQRAKEIDAQAATEAGAALASERAAQLADASKLVDATYHYYAQKLRSGDVKVAPADLARLHKLRVELWQAPEAQPPEPPSPGVEQTDTPGRKLEVLRALHDAGVLAQLQQLVEPRPTAADQEPDEHGRGDTADGELRDARHKTDGNQPGDKHDDDLPGDQEEIQ